MGAKERNKNYVLEKAKEVFLERGITGVSMADIAKEADFGVAFLNFIFYAINCASFTKKICRKADMTRSSCLRNIFRGLW
mgnify:CR=1 FL=1